MGETCSTMGEMRNVYNFLIGKFEGEGSLGGSYRNES